MTDERYPVLLQPRIPSSDHEVEVWARLTVEVGLDAAQRWVQENLEAVRWTSPVSAEVSPPA